MLVKAVMTQTPSLAERLADRDARGVRDVPDDGFVDLDLYRLPESDLNGVTGIALAGDVDQIFLAAHQSILDDFVRGGGRVLVNGHVQRPFLTGLTKWRKLVFERPADLMLTRHNDHPVWRGSKPEDFLYSTGEPGPHEWAYLEQIGVAGFYGRGYTADPPADATVVHTIGPTQAIIDFEYPLGAGKVLVHSGNDLQSFFRAERGTAELLGQLTTWLGAAA